MTMPRPAVFPVNTPPEPVPPASASSAVASTPSRAVVWVADDGSPAAATAVPVAQTIARQLGAEVELFTEQQSDAAHAILAATEDPRVVLVVLATHGREVEAGRGLGSVAEAVMARSERPVLLVRPEATGQSVGSAHPLRRLLFPLDGTPRTLAGLTPAIAFARQLGASVDLLCVLRSGDQRAREPGTFTSPQYVDQPQHEWPQWVREVKARVASLCGGWPPGMAVQALLTVDGISDEILRVAGERHHDAIVLVRRSHLELGRAAVLRAVVAAMPCPVLLLAAPAAA
jgi:nucleotide-binding universal stress UspA family protein